MKLLIITILGLALSSGFTSAESENEKAPLLYYFSNDLNQFIIERANGTDRRTLAEYVIPQEHQLIAGPGWSPSGNWFAWYSGDPQSGGSTNGDAMLVDYAGNQPFHIRNQCAANFIEWSASEDLLLVGCHRASLDYIYLVFDPDQHKEILMFDASSFGLTGYIADISKVHWSPAGDSLVVYYAHSTDFDETDYWMKVFSIDGSLMAAREFYTKHLTISQAYWSFSGNVVYIASDGAGIVVENFQRNMSVVLETPFNTIGCADWSPDGNYSFIYESKLATFMDDADNINPVWLLSVPDKSLTLLSETARPLNLRRQADRFYPTTTWSSADNLGFIVDSSSTLSLVIPNPLEIATLHEIVNPGRELYPQFVRWHRDGEHLTVVEYAWRQYQGTFYVYDVNNRQPLNTFDVRITWDIFSYSATGRYLAYSSSDCDGICMVNTTSNEVAQIPFAYPPDRISSATELLWHPEEDWIIAAGNIDGAWRHLIVTNADGTVNRSVGQCGLTTACFGWMPPD